MLKRVVCSITVSTAVTFAAAVSSSSTTARSVSQSKITNTQQKRFASVFAAPTRPVLFDLKQKRIQERKEKELERSGVSSDGADAGGDDDWMSPEERARLEAEEAERKAEKEQKAKEFWEKRQKEDALKMQKFKEFRAKQIQMSRERKKKQAAELQQRQQVGRASRFVKEEVDDSVERTMELRGDFDTNKEAELPLDRDAKRALHRMQIREEKL